MSNLKQVLEISRKQFLTKTDPSFIHHKLYTKQLPQKNTTGAQYIGVRKQKVGRITNIEIVFLTNSATFPGEEQHQQKIIPLDLVNLLRDEKSDLTHQKKVLQAVNHGDLLVGCTCPAFLYWGYAFITTKLDVVHPKFKEKRPPDIRNPKQKGIICKHLDLVMQVLPFNFNSIAKDVKGITLPKSRVK